MIQIPQAESLATGTMNRVFSNTAATYKFYWLLSLLDMHVREKQTVMPALDLASRMVAYAWYPVEYFRLSFGKNDSMAQIIPEVALLTGINVGEAAGQSVCHSHMHLIPRYKGDVPNPKGGVRGVIPSKQKY